MKNQNKKCKRCSNNKFSNSNKARNRTILKSNIKEELIYNRRNKKFKYMITDARYIRRNQALLDEFVIYSILNTGIDMKLGVAASLIARSVLALYNQLVANRAKNPYINEWQNSGFGGLLNTKIKLKLKNF
ncbi:uncharacterized protein LOC105193884 isoform X2 [Solenopsis invicta]|uniref:uncharacterized protein LOC105193884 isoform X2 n=1 Tax=Solenopsis invicta TaxID=13686 RepID=UPI000595B745|nr:uncharacterized protein LOC105193884 isoform X2 [Solenopsis invicta]